MDTFLIVVVFFGYLYGVATWWFIGARFAEVVSRSGIVWALCYAPLCLGGTVALTVVFRILWAVMPGGTGVSGFVADAGDCVRGGIGLGSIAWATHVLRGWSDPEVRRRYGQMHYPWLYKRDKAEGVNEG